MQKFLSDCTIVQEISRKFLNARDLKSNIYELR